MERFFIQERNNSIDLNNDKLFYNAGPAHISILGFEEQIVIKLRDNWSYLMNDLIKTVEEAWGVEHYTVENNIITIPLNYQIVLNFLDNIIIFR